MEATADSSKKKKLSFAWLKFALEGALFVAIASVIGVNLQYPLTDEANIGISGHLKMSAYVFGIAAVLAFFPAVSGYFLMRSIRRFQRRRFIALGSGLGALFGVTLIYVMPYGGLYLDRMSEAASVQEMLRLLCFPLAPLFASILFFVRLSLKEIWIGPSASARAIEKAQ